MTQITKLPVGGWESDITLKYNYEYEGFLIESLNSEKKKQNN